MQLVNIRNIKKGCPLHFVKMRKFKNIITRTIVLILALQILNMSISCRITNDSFFSKIDNSVNIADHALEYIIEDVMGFKNAFPEIKENQQQHHVSNTQKVQEFKLFSFQPIIDNCYSTKISTDKYSLLIIHPYNEYAWEINPPPPKVA